MIHAPGSVPFIQLSASWREFAELLDKLVLSMSSIKVAGIKPTPAEADKIIATLQEEWGYPLDMRSVEEFKELCASPDCN
jgi:hypothetical protein